MINCLKSVFTTITIASLLYISCSVPQRVLQQEDMPVSELNDPALKTKVLIAARYSEYKEAVIEKFKNAFADQPVYIKVIGMEYLENENTEQYTAILLISKCMAWSLDRNIVDFLKHNEDHGKMIVFTTSGDGNWQPKMKVRDFDTISSASEMARVDEIATQLIEKVNLLILG